MSTSRFAFMVSSNTDALEPDKNAKIFIKDVNADKFVASTAYVDGDSYDYKIFNNQDGVYYANLPAGIYSVYTGAASNKVAQQGLQNIEHTGGKAVTHINDEQTEAHASDKISHSGSTVKAKLESLDSSKAEIDDTKTDDSHAWSGEKINSELSSKADSDTDDAAEISYDGDDAVQDAGDYVKTALDTIVNTLGTVDPSSDFDSTYNYLEGLATLKAAFSRLDQKIKNNYDNIESTAGDVSYKEVLWNETDASSISEHPMSSDTEKPLRKFVVMKRSSDSTIKVNFNGKCGDNATEGIVTITVGSYNNSVLIVGDSYSQKQISLDISGLDNDIYEGEISYQRISGSSSVDAKYFNVVKEG